MIKRLIIVGTLCCSALASADPLEFISANFASNGTTRTSWLTTMGISSPTVSGIFDDLPDGNIHGIANIYPGLTLSSSNGSALVTGLSSQLGSSNPIGTKAVALVEDITVTLTFAQPVDYFSYISIDAGDVAITAFYTDASTSTHAGGSPASSGDAGVFFGLYRNDRPQITSVTLFGTGGDNEWGLDNIEYGTVPEPATIVALLTGTFVAARRRKTSKVA